MSSRKAPTAAMVPLSSFSPATTPTRRPPSQHHLTGKTALVTGSTGGIGYATAAGLHASGATVVINGRTAERVQDAIDGLGGGDRIIGVAADVGTATGCEALLDAVPHVVEHGDEPAQVSGT